MNEISYIGKLNTEKSGLGVKGDYAVICFFNGGELRLENSTLTCKDGDVAVIPPLFKYGATGTNAVSITLNKALLPVKEATVIEAEDSEELREIIARAARCKQSDDKAQDNVLSAYGNLISALIAAYCAPNGYSPAVQSVIDDAEKHIGDPTYSQESFMRSLPLNYDYVRKLFKKEVGVTPHEYLMRARMARAKAILLSGVTNRYSDYTVTQIAEACGYAEPLYFSRVFKKYYGVAPSHYLSTNS